MVENDTRKLISPETAFVDHEAPGCRTSLDGFLDRPFTTYQEVIEMMATAIFREDGTTLRAIRQDQPPPLVLAAEREIGRKLWDWGDGFSTRFAHTSAMFSPLFRCGSWGRSDLRKNVRLSALEDGFIVAPGQRPRYRRRLPLPGMSTLAYGAYRVHNDSPRDWTDLVLTHILPHLVNTMRDPDSVYSVGFVDDGIVGAEAVFGAAHYAAKVTAWQIKWRMMNIRPQEAGILAERQRLGVGEKLWPELADSAIAAEAFRRWGSWHIPQAYPEGAPRHPAYPAGHAACAGAMATVAKAISNDVPMEVSTNLGAEEVASSHALVDQLAVDIATSRTLAGVHFLIDDYDGLLVGERAALGAISDMGYPVKPGHSFYLFNGQKYTF